MVRQRSNHPVRRFVIGWVALLGAAAVCGAQEIAITPSHADGVYAVGEKIEWRVELKGSNGADLKSLDYVVKRGQLTEIKSGKLDLSGGGGTIDTSLDQPGTVLTILTATVNGKPFKRLAGAVVDPGKIAPSAPPPGDFDEFWRGKIAELQGIPPNPQLEAADAGKPDVDYFKVRLDNIRGTHVYGQLARPKRAGKFPALLLVQYAGVYGLPKNNVVRRAEQGWLALNIMAHDLPFDQPDEFYKKLATTTLNDYPAIGNSDREKSYFLRMYLGCYRAADYLAGRDDWDGKTLVVMGTSQGGQQSIITGGFYPKITAMIANVPGGCDVTGPSAGRSAGFPYWSNHAPWSKNPAIIETGRTFDAVNFAGHIQCPALVSCGLIDETCPAAGVLAAYDQMKGPKEILILPNSDHHGNNNAQARFFSRSEKWLAAIVKGQPVPPPD
jgi:cephalosporin-C deacetylase